MIKKFLIGTVALAALSTAAFAADLPSRRAPPVYVPPPIPVFSWTGLYVGGQVGYTWGDDNYARGTSHPKGIIGGGHIGYNFAGIPGFGLGTGGLVFGVEGDVDGTDYRATTGAIGGRIGSSTIRKDIEGSARARLGVAVDRALFYATGGAAFASFKENYYTGAAGGGALLATPTHTRVGWTVGGGVEYAITPAWSLRAEYRYADFGSFTDTIGAITTTRRETEQRAQVGFSYKFDAPLAPAPVVARY